VFEHDNPSKDLFFYCSRWNLRNNRSQRDKDYRKNLLAEIITFEEQAVS